MNVGDVERVLELAELGSVSRRTFLRSTAAIALLSAVPFGLSKRFGRLVPGSLTRSTFSPLLGQSFRVMSGAYVANLVLDEVNDLFPVSKIEDEHRFSLIFTGPPHGPRIDEIAEFRHEDVGAFSMFVTPVDRVANATTHYEAVVNRNE
jgi:hypothetical protein